MYLSIPRGAVPGAEPVWRSALDGHLEAGVFGAMRADRPGVMLQERQPSALVQISAPQGMQDLSQISPSLEPCPFPGPGRAARGKDVTVMWTGPEQWLAVFARPLTWPIPGNSDPAAAAPDVSITDLGHARTIIRISGPNAVDVLLKGCPLDLEQYAVDDCAGSLLGHVNVQLHRESEDGFDVFVFRSFGLATWNWLGDASMEFGVEVMVGQGY